MIKRILVLAVLAAIVGLITLSGGEITKLFVKANRCHRTKLLLFGAGCITALLIAIIGALYTKFVSSETQQKVYNDLWNEQFRYTTDEEPFRYNIGGNPSTWTPELVDEEATNSGEEAIEGVAEEFISDL